MPKDTRERIIDARSSAFGGGAVAAAGGGGGGGGVTDHGALTGLADDDHTQYLRADGGRALAGSLAVAAGATVDGVDISAHAADPDAHHARVTAGDGVLVTGQQVSVRLASDPGLEFAGGALRVRAAGGNPYVSRSAAGLSIAASGAAWQVVGLSAPNTLGLLASTTDGDATPDALLRVNALGAAKVRSFDVAGAATIGQGLTAAQTGFRVIHHTHDYAHAHVVINPGPFWSLDEQFGLDVDDNLLVRGWIVGKHAIQIEGALLLAHYDGPPGTDAGTATGHMGQVGTVAGDVGYYAGRFGKAIAIGDARTNHIANGDFRLGLNSWGEWGTGVYNGIAQGDGFTGRQFLRVVTNGGNQGRYQNLTLYTGAPLAVGSTYTLSVWVRVLSGAPTISYFDGTNHNFLPIPPDPTEEKACLWEGDGRWHRVTYTFTANASPIQRVYLGRRDGSGENGEYWFDGVQCETGSIATPFVYFSRAAGGQLSYLRQTAFKPQVGTIMAWVHPGPATDYAMIFRYNSPTAGQVQISRGAGAEATALRVVWGTTAYFVYGAFDGGDWTHVAVTMDGTWLTVYLNGKEALPAPVSAGVGGVADDGVAVTVGGQGDANRWNGLIDELVILDRAASADEIRAVYDSNAPVFAETSTWHWRAGRNRVYADAEGFWMVDAQGQAVIGAYAGDELDSGATKSWGGVSLGQGDVLIGSGNQYMLWDDSAATLDISAKLRVRDESEFVGVATLGAAGGIWQGDGSFASPVRGVKLWRDGNYGRLAGYSGGLEQFSISSEGKIVAGAVTLERAGLTVGTVGGMPSAPIRFDTGSGVRSSIAHVIGVAGDNTDWLAFQHYGPEQAGRAFAFQGAKVLAAGGLEVTGDAAVSGAVSAASATVAGAVAAGGLSAGAGADIAAHIGRWAVGYNAVATAARLTHYTQRNNANAYVLSVGSSSDANLFVNAPGTTIFLRTGNADRVYVSSARLDVAAGMLIGLDWAVPTFSIPFGAYAGSGDNAQNANLRVKKFGDLVYLRGVFRVMTDGQTGEIICTLPSGYAPGKWVGAPVVRVRSNGTVEILAVQIYQDSGGRARQVRFTEQPSETTTTDWYSINAVYSTAAE